MITVVDQTGRTFKRQEQVDSEIEGALGTTDNYGKPFELILLKWKGIDGRGIANIPQMPKGFQNTTIIRQDDNNVKVVHSAEGHGCVRFVPDDRKVAYGKIARTPHNIKMLVHTFKDGQWIVMDATIRKEIEEKYTIMWNGISDAQKSEILTTRKLGRTSPHQLPPNFGDNKTHTEVERIMKENVGKEEELKNRDKLVENLTFELKKAQLEIQKLSGPQPTPIEQVPVPTEPVDCEPVKEDWSVMKIFSLQAIARKMGVTVDRAMDKPTLVKLMKEKQDANQRNNS